jgi:hypothetical protein
MRSENKRFIKLPFPSTSRAGSGQHLVYEKDTTPLCNLHVTLMQGMGLEREHFVDGTGRLTGLS